MPPGRFFHLLPFAEGVEPELKQPLRFLLAFGDMTYDILVQALGGELLLNVGDESFLVLLGGYVFEYFVHNWCKDNHIIIIFGDMNTFGRIFRVSVFGESHGPQVGVLLDGVPEGIALSEKDFEEDIARRAPGAAGTTARREADRPQIISGVYDGHTTGAPLCIVFQNEDVRSQDYADFDAVPRPGHADYVAAVKWDWANDPRGGGHFSGRLTLPVVAAGVVAKKILEGMKFSAALVELGGSADSSEWESLIAAAAADGDSLGAVVECTVEDVPIGLGEPFWDSVESLLSHAIFSIPGVRGIEFGDGFRASAMRGSEHNDPFGPEGPVKNGSGGANGGITNGAPLKFRVAFKPTSSISKPQKTWNFATESMTTLSVKGRHDVCFARRTPVIVEAMAAIVLADLV